MKKVHLVDDRKQALKALWDKSILAKAGSALLDSENEESVALGEAIYDSLIWSIAERHIEIWKCDLRGAETVEDAIRNAERRGGASDQSTLCEFDLREDACDTFRKMEKREGIDLDSSDEFDRLKGKLTAFNTVYVIEVMNQNGEWGYDSYYRWG